MFGQAVAFAHDIASNFLFVTEADAGNFAKSRVGFFGSHGFDNQADAPLLGVMGLADFAGPRIKILEQGGTLDLFGLGVAAMTDKLINSWHEMYCNMARSQE